MSSKILDEPAAREGMLEQIRQEMLDMEYIYDIIYGRNDRAEVIRPSIEHVDQDYTPGIIMAIVFDDFWNYCANKHNRERQTIKRDMLLCCQEALKPDIRAVVATLTGTDKLALALDTNGRTDSEAEEYAYSCAVRIRDYLLEKLGYSCSIGISHYCAHTRNLWYAYEESFKALQQGFFQGNCQVMLYSRPFSKKRKELMVSEFQSAKKELIVALSKDDSDRCRKSVKLLMIALMNEGADMNDVRSTFIVTMANIAEYALQSGISAAPLSDKLIEAVSAITGANTALEVTDISERFLLEIIGKKASSKPEGIEGAILESKAYIRHFLSTQLTLEDVAEIFGYNASYFSRNFNRYARMSFREYLNQARIEKAKEYLEKSHFTINEIAAKIGFQNQSYFSNVFRNKEGMSPAVWRAEKRK